MIFSTQQVVQAIILLAGTVFFAQPPLVRFCDWLDRTFPHWRGAITLEHTFLRGMPTNAQIAITILRQSEQDHAPIPPAPPIEQTPPMQPVTLSADELETEIKDLPLGVDEGQLLDAMSPDASILNSAGGRCSDVQADKGTKPHRLRHLLGHVRRGIKATVGVAQKADRLRAKAGRENAKNRVGVLQDRSNSMRLGQGPSTFRARNEAKEGQVTIDINGVVSFEDLWSVRASDIVELRKHSGLGLKTKLVLAWAMDLDVKDGLEIRDRGGNAYVLTAVSDRDQLFDRLCAIGGQRWDVL
jgi:hypothetical protein